MPCPGGTRSQDDDYEVGVEFLFLNEANQKKLATLFPAMATGD
jgi:hypothetical protein